MIHKILRILWFLFLTCPKLIFSLDMDDTITKLRQEKRKLILEAHHRYRNLHSARKLSMDENMNFYAQQWVDHRIETRVLKPRPNKKYGENLWSVRNVYIQELMTSEDSDPVKFWYNQIKNYSGVYNADTESKWEFFTQLVWKESRKIGIGIASGRVGTFVACYYDPPGNGKPNDSFSVTFGRFLENVQPPNGKSWPSPINYVCYLLVIIILFISLGAWVVY